MHRGVDAVYAGLELREGAFRVESGSHTGRAPDLSSIGGILLEGMRRMDEARRAGVSASVSASLPAPASDVAATPPALPSLPFPRSPIAAPRRPEPIGWRRWAAGAAIGIAIALGIVGHR